MTNLALDVRSTSRRSYLTRLVHEYRELRTFLPPWPAFKCARHLARAHLT